MNKNNNCVIKVSKDDKIILEYIKSETNSSYSKIISILLKKFNSCDTDEKNKINDEISKNKFYTGDENKIIKLKLTENEVNILKEISKNTGFSSITKQAKFLLLNSIKNEKLFTNIEMDEFIKTRIEINAIGKNISILKILRSGNSVKINENNLNKTMDNIRDKIDILSDHLGTIIEKNNERI
ncbi:hypothetical protein [Campylobacter hyointestinalis]|uniref:hypothetical protein n=1 Tax=Campylobacter hyointestinalis TaxID=198 RepID=UPI000DCB02B3|nr:hypothetical protein [Campylobacter hyointestinalis]RAZ25702.1 hypothetical protein CHL9752_02305 [Campylobacter hyointestinalis subsp. lawsonii]RAZ40206.1 hypothetical protein CHL9426_01010 [Campylobacter hyointestinalis subsp. lawsonii]